MSEFSVIIPTLQRAKELHELVEMCAAHPRVLEVLVINNAPQPLSWASQKVRVLQQVENIYVNPAWNLGAREARGKYLAILNDDVLFDPEVFDYVARLLRMPWVGLVGPNYRCFNLTARDARRARPVYKMPWGYGTAMFLRRDKYEPIPDRLRIYWGDNWLFYGQRAWNVEFLRFPIRTEMSTTSSRPEFSPLMEADYAEAETILPRLTAGPYLRRHGAEARAHRALLGAKRAAQAVRRMGTRRAG